MCACMLTGVCNINTCMHLKFYSSGLDLNSARFTE